MGVTPDRISGFLVLASCFALLTNAAAAAPPASCVCKFVGEWSYPGGTTTVYANGTAQPHCAMCVPVQTWTCKRQYLSLQQFGAAGAILGDTRGRQPHAIFGRCRDTDAGRRLFGRRDGEKTKGRHRLGNAVSGKDDPSGRRAMHSGDERQLGAEMQLPIHLSQLHHQENGRSQLPEMGASPAFGAVRPNGVAAPGQRPACLSI